MLIDVASRPVNREPIMTLLGKSKVKATSTTLQHVHIHPSNSLERLVTLLKGISDSD